MIIALFQFCKEKQMCRVLKKLKGITACMQVQRQTLSCMNCDLIQDKIIPGIPILQFSLIIPTYTLTKVHFNRWVGPFWLMH